jgi:PAS domain S-box-containing protein
MHNEVLRSIRRVAASATEPHLLLRQCADALARGAGFSLVCVLLCEGRRALQIATAGDRKRSREAKLTLETGVLPNCVEFVGSGAGQVVHYPDDTRCERCVAVRADEWTVTLPLAFGGARRGALIAVLSAASASDEEEMALLRDAAEEITRGLLELERIAALEDAQSRLRNMAERGASNALQAHALDSLPVGVLVTDRGGRIVHANPAAGKMAGVEPSELAGMALRSVSSIEVNELQHGVLRAEGWRGTIESHRRGGASYREELTVAPMIEDGSVQHYVALKRPVAEVPGAGRKLEADVLELLAALPVAMGAAEAGGQLLSLNPAFTTAFGYTLADASTVTELGRLLFPDEERRTRVLDAYARRLVGAEDFPPTREVAVCKDGRAREVELFGVRLGEAVVAVFGDLTERTAAAEALRASEERYRNLLDHLSAVVVTTSHDGIVTFTSSAIRRLGVEPAAVEGRHVAELFHAGDRAAVHRMLEQATDASSPALDLRLAVGGAERIVRSSARAIRGEAVGAVGFILDDVTTERSVERQLIVAQRMEAVGRLASGIAHDFNNVLSVILSYTEMVASSLPSGTAERRDLEEVIVASHRAEALTRQLLAFGRKQILVDELVDVNALAASLTKLLERLVGEDVKLVVRADARVATTRVDRSQFEQVLMNLVINSRDALPDGGKIEIATRTVTLDEARATALEVKPGEYIELDVIDDGVGIPPEHVARIFEPFFTTKENGKGTGLGLSTVYGIVRQSGGGLEVESELGRGTTIRLYFRVSHGAVSLLPVPSREMESARAGERILVVEDEPALRAVIKRVLTRAGYSVVEAGDAFEALAVFGNERSKIDLVLTDVVMPGMTGRELADRIHKLSPSMPILFMSGYTDEAIARHGVLGSSFLRKPFDHATLTARVRRAIEEAP